MLRVDRAPGGLGAVKWEGVVLVRCFRDVGLLGLLRKTLGALCRLPVLW
jgi:hypothetical protein